MKEANEKAKKEIEEYDAHYKLAMESYNLTIEDNIKEYLTKRDQQERQYSSYQN